VNDFKEITIPGDVLDDENLSATAKILYGKIARLSFKEGYCWASNKFLGGTKSVNRTSYNIKELEKYGYINCSYENHGYNRKIYICKIDKKLSNNGEPPLSKTISPLTENGEAPSPKTVNKHIQEEHPKEHTQEEHTNLTESLKKHFIKQWQSNADVFNALARLQSPNDFDEWWAKSAVTKDEIDRAIKNVVDGVRTGAVKRRFIPGSPDKFILNGWIQRSQEPYDKDEEKNNEPNYGRKL
jgi:hypothetical protein